MQNRPPTPQDEPQLFQNHTSCFGASICVATISWPPRTVAPGAMLTSPFASGLSNESNQFRPVMTGLITSALSACSIPVFHLAEGPIPRRADQIDPEAILRFKKIFLPLLQKG